MCTSKMFGAVLLLCIAIELPPVQSQGPRFEPAPYGYVEGKDCRRACNGYTMQCWFHFRVETMYSMSKACYNCPSVFTDCLRPDCIVAGGVRRVVTAVNRQIPGPTMELCEGDIVRVLVENKLETGEATTIHWHGLHQRWSPYMDGVPFVTQCPIHSKNNFTYQFRADTPGTHWWHSHEADQRGDGHFGALIVRQAPRNNPHSSLYKDLDEHVIVINDWNDRRRMDVFQAYAKAGQFLEPNGILINGYGDQQNSRNTPIANFAVTQGKAYRFRLINTNFFDCPIEISVDNHKLIIISSDGMDVRANTVVDSIMSHSGERYDFILKADRPVGTYYIRAQGKLLCERLNTFQIATLRYDSRVVINPSGSKPTYSTASNPNALVLNPLSAMNTPRSVTIDKLTSLQQQQIANPTKRFFISLDMSGIDQPNNHRSTLYGFNQVLPDMQVRTPQLNHISFKHFPFNMMAGRYSISSSDFCTAETWRNRDCERNFCECPHVLEADLNEVVEMVIFDEMDQEDAPAIHPVHLHGYSFHVVHMSEYRANFNRPEIMSMHHRFERNLNGPILKDTVAVPRGGVVIIRFVANNPGFWFMHCHIDVHSIEGMELVLKVGNNYQISNPPPNFPVCGNWHAPA